MLDIGLKEILEPGNVVIQKLMQIEIQRTLFCDYIKQNLMLLDTAVFNGIEEGLVKFDQIADPEAVKIGHAGELVNMLLAGGFEQQFMECPVVDIIFMGVLVAVQDGLLHIQAFFHLLLHLFADLADNLEYDLRFQTGSDEHTFADLGQIDSGYSGFFSGENVDQGLFFELGDCLVYRRSGNAQRCCDLRFIDDGIGWQPQMQNVIVEDTVAVVGQTLSGVARTDNQVLLQSRITPR